MMENAWLGQSQKRPSQQETVGQGKLNPSLRYQWRSKAKLGSSVSPVP